MISKLYSKYSKLFLIKVIFPPTKQKLHKTNENSFDSEKWAYWKFCIQIYCDCIFN